MKSVAVRPETSKAANYASDLAFGATAHTLLAQTGSAAGAITVSNVSVGTNTALLLTGTETKYEDDIQVSNHTYSFAYLLNDSTPYICEISQTGETVHLSNDFGS